MYNLDGDLCSSSDSFNSFFDRKTRIDNSVGKW